MEVNNELQQKRQEYTEYIYEHKRFVENAFFYFKTCRLNILSGDEMETLSYEIKNHDISKFSKEEFEAYRKHFFPCSFEKSEDFKEEFDIAKKHHYLVNDHHPQNPSRKYGLNKIACIHNILDWIAMSYKFKDNVWDFYQHSNIKFKLNRDERAYIEEVLAIMEQYRDTLYDVEVEL